MLNMVYNLKTKNVAPKINCMVVKKSMWNNTFITNYFKNSVTHNLSFIYMYYLLHATRLNGLL